MRQIIHCVPLVIALFFSAICANAQILDLHHDYTPAGWPFLWDIEEGPNGELMTISEQGILYMRVDGVWETMDLNTMSNGDARGMDVDSEGNIWVGTYDGLYKINTDTIILYNSDNSDLPSNTIWHVRVADDVIWLGMYDNGLVRIIGDQFTHYTEDNSLLESNYIDDMEVQDDGTLVFAASEHVFFIKGSWSKHDLHDIFVWGMDVSDLMIDTSQNVWFATNIGVVRYLDATGEFEHLETEYGRRKYSGIIYTPQNELWLCEIFQGLWYYTEPEVGYFFEGTINNSVPDQVFDFLYQDDTVRVTGNIGATVTGLTVTIVDEDGDGFPAGEDCDDTDPNINPDAEEIPNNEIDEDCDGMDLVSSTHYLAEGQLSIYPNPATDIIHLQAEGSKVERARLYTLAGVQVIDAVTPTSLRVTDLAPGVYVLEVIMDGSMERILEKIVIPEAR